MVMVYDGNVLDSRSDVIAHQVNCMGVMGAGVARQIKQTFPWAYTQYKEYCKPFRKDPSKILGNVFFSVGTNDNEPMIANLFGQVDYGTDKQYTNLEDGLFPALHKLHELSRIMDIHSIAIPYGIGCGLGGANWDDVFNGIVSEFDNDKNINVNIYKLL